MHALSEMNLNIHVFTPDSSHPAAVAVVVSERSFLLNFLFLGWPGLAIFVALLSPPSTSSGISCCGKFLLIFRGFFVSLTLSPSQARRLVLLLRPTVVASVVAWGMRRGLPLTESMAAAQSARPASSAVALQCATQYHERITHKRHRDRASVFKMRRYHRASEPW